VLVEPNTYFENIDYRGKNIVVGSLFLTTDDTSMISRTIIDGSANGSVVSIAKNENSTARLIGFTIRNGKVRYGGGIHIRSASPTISHCIIMNNVVEGTNPIGGGIYIRNSRAIIYGCEIMYNSALAMDNNNGWGGGISIESDSLVSIINCKIHHNQSTSSSGGIGVADAKARIIGCEIAYNSCYTGGSGIGCQDSDLHLVNNTVSGNRGTNNNTAVFFIRSSPIIQNCVIWYNPGTEEYRSIDGGGGTPEIYFSNIQGGFDTLAVMDLEPMFVDTSAGDFRLTHDSPCIDAGDPDSAGLSLPLVDLDGHVRFLDGYNDGVAVIDMGAYEYVPLPVRVEDRNEMDHPHTFHLKQNYPNPFNPNTTIEYLVPDKCHIEIKVCDLLGREIRSLSSGQMSPGSYQVTWNGLDDTGSTASSGVYFYTLTAEGFSETRKLLLIR
jgi:hypothetical protein